MADNNLNPGQQHYHDLYNNQGSASDVENQAANNWEHNYSSPIDYSKPRDNSSSIQDHNHDTDYSRDFLSRSEDAAASPIQSNDRDISIGQRERGASSMTVSGFDNQSSNKATKQRMSGFKKKLVAGGIVLFAVGGVFMVGFTALSGPLQFVQVASIVKDFVMNVSDGQKQARSVSNSRSISRLLNKGNTIEERKMNNRVGILGRAQAQAQADRLGAKGVSFKTDGNGYSAGMDIDMSKYLGVDNPTEAQIKKVVGDMDIGDKYKISGSTLTIADDLSYSEMKRTIKVLDDPGKWSVRSWMQSRATLKRQGFTSWLHPFQKLKNAVDKKLGITSLLSKAMGEADDTEGRSRDAKDSDEAQDGVDGKNENLDDGDKIDMDSAKNSGDDLIEAGKDVADNITDASSDAGRGILGAAEGVTNQFNKFVSSNPMQALQLIISIVCVIRDLTNNAGPYKMATMVNIAERGATLILGIASQIMSGEDITMEDVGASVEQMLYDTVQKLTVDGQPTGETVTSSLQESPEVSCTLGTSSCGEPRASDLSSDLAAVGDSAHITGDANINNAITAFLNDQNISGIITGGLCIANDILGFISGLVDIAGTVLGTLAGALLDNSNIIGSFISKGINMLYGTPIDLETITPRQWGTVLMYGGVFLSNDQSLLAGAVKLTSRQALELNLENRRYLAWENNRKPLLARLADPSDYNSSISQIARAVKINTGDQSFATQLANTVKLFSSAPSLIATASGQLLGGNAYAAASYDYGVPTYAWTLDDMNNIVTDSSEYDMVENAYNATTALQKEDEAGELGDRPLHDYAEQCLTVEIGDANSDFKVTPINNDDGTAWNYVDNATNDIHECANKANQAENKALSLYVMDYFNTVSGMCYEGDESDADSQSACNEMGVNTAGRTSSASSFSQDADAMIAQFESDTNDSGDWDGVHGRQCVDMSAWFIENYTTLTYGNGNGKDVVSQLIQKNPQLGSPITNPDEIQAPAIFSANCNVKAMTQNCKYGHTGVIVRKDENNTIYTIENGNSVGSFQGTYTPEQYQGADIINVGEFLK